MILIIAAWVYFFLWILAMGAGFLKLTAKLVGDHSGIRFGIFYQFWFGFAVLIGLSQVISLFLPMGKLAFWIINIIAITLVSLHFRSAWHRLNSFCEWLSTPKGLLSSFVVCVILVLVSYSANREVQHADTFIYHFNAVKWAKEYPVVPGLANLHSRLGFNSSFFLFAALTEIGIYADHSAHIALSFLIVVSLVHWFFVISNGREVMAKRIFCMMTFLFLVFHAVQQIDITSLSTDYPMAVLTLVFCVVLLDKLDHKLLLLLPLSAVVFAFKLSGMLTIGIGLITLAGYAMLFRYRGGSMAMKKVERRSMATSFILLCVIASGFVIRNVIVSGWLVYPFPIGNMHLPWSIPKPYVLDMIDWIKSYPKIPNGASPTTIKEHSFFFWFMQWFSQFRLSMEFNLFCLSVLILLWAAFQVSSFGKFFYARLNMVLLLLFSAASILFWFMSAPELRFGSVYFFMFFASAVVLLFEGSKHKSVLKVLLCGVFLYPIIDSRVPGFYAPTAPQLFTFAYTKPRKLVKVIASPPDEKPALYIYMPLEGDACGNSPIPCTPYAGGFLHNHRLIRQRVPGDLSKGFLPIK